MNELRRLFPQLLRAEADETTQQAARALLEDALGQPPPPPVALPGDVLQPDRLNTVLRCYAPTALLQWDWLRRISHPAKGHQSVNSALFAAYLDAVGLDTPNQSPAAQYRALITHFTAYAVRTFDGSERYAQRTLHLSAELDLAFSAMGTQAAYPPDAAGNTVWLLPCLILSLSCFPAERLGEILGFTLDYCQDDGWLDWLERQLRSHALPDDYCRRLRALRTKHLPALLPYSGLPGVERGRALYRHGQQALLQALQPALTQPLNPLQPVAAVLRRKLPYALGHHGRVELHGKTLDRWLAEGDWAALRSALRQSPYVNLQAMEHCRFSRSMAFGGAMYGVFDEQEQALLRAWLQEENPGGTQVGAADLPVSATGERLEEGQFNEGLTENNAPAALINVGYAARTFDSAELIDVGYAVRTFDGAERYAQRTLQSEPATGSAAPTQDDGCRPNPQPATPAQHNDARHLFHRLLHSENHPDSLPAAARYAQTVLARTRWLAPLQPRLRRAFAYEPEAFFQRVDAIYQREMARYRPLSGRPKLPRELYVWGIRQMAPAILLDGCWLANLATAEPAQDEIRKRLLRIFADEVGCGRPEHHHANVYRRLLANLDIRLPEVSSLEFAEHPSLCDAAFVLPTYLLAIGLQPERYFPEILGLNLAIELSGLGAGYMQLIDALRHYGIDPTIIQLHLSIDNLASGHAALARVAIMLYMAQLQSQGGPDAVAAIWPRVWNGYLSLASAGLPFAWAGVQRYVGLTSGMDRIACIYPN
ncbi:MAG: iron-containing redox enzyme family protein [Methylococcaceae bacterium]|nr:MAG: iron-containing redox enzyme family protein [Methylococcaceae bacterium]